MGTEISQTVLIAVPICNLVSDIGDIPSLGSPRVFRSRYVSAELSLPHHCRFRHQSNSAERGDRSDDLLVCQLRSRIDVS